MAVPSMLIVAPSGSEKLTTSLGTPSLFWQALMFSGSVAFELQVLKANSITGRNALKKFIGLVPVSSRTAAP